MAITRYTVVGAKVRWIKSRGYHIFQDRTMVVERMDGLQAHVVIRENGQVVWRGVERVENLRYA